MAEEQALVSIYAYKIAFGPAVQTEQYQQQTQGTHS